MLTFFSHYFPEYIRTYLCFTSSLDTSTPLGADILLDRLYDGSIRSVSDFTIAPIQKHGSNKSYQQINAKNIIFIQKHGSINKSYQQFYAKNLIFIQKHGSNKF